MWFHLLKFKVFVRVVDEGLGFGGAGADERVSICDLGSFSLLNLKLYLHNICD